MAMDRTMAEIEDNLRRAHMMQGGGSSAAPGVISSTSTIIRAASFVPGEPQIWVVDCSNLRHLLFLVRNGVDVDITAQIFGAIDARPHPEAQFDIGNAIIVPARKAQTLAVDLDTYWHPFIGVRMLSMVLASGGSISAEAYMQFLWRL